MSDRVDVKSWLAVNKLGYVEKVFVERNIAVEELVDFDTEELKDFAKDLKLDALATRRFIKAIEDQKAYFKKGAQVSKNANQVMSSSSSIPQTMKPMEMTKSVSDGSDGAVAPGGNINEDVAPPEAAFGMPLQYLIVNPLEGLPQEGHGSEGEGGIVPFSGGGEGSHEKVNSPVNANVKVNANSASFTPVIKFEAEKPDIVAVRQSSNELKMKGGIQGKDDKVHIIVTPFEQEALVKLQDRLDVVETLIDGIQSSFDTLNGSAAQMKEEIRKKNGIGC